MEPYPRATRWQSGTFTEFFEAASPYLVRLGYLLLGDRAVAEDVAQDVLEEIYKRWQGLREESMLGYAHTAVVNRARSVGRRRAVASKFATLLATPEAVPDSDLNDPWLWLRVQALPRRQREIIVLRYWCDLTEGEIAKVLGISAGTVKSGAHRALSQLERVVRGAAFPIEADSAANREDV